MLLFKRSGKTLISEKKLSETLQERIQHLRYSSGDETLSCKTEETFVAVILSKIMV